VTFLAEMAERNELRRAQRATGSARRAARRDALASAAHTLQNALPMPAQPATRPLCATRAGFTLLELMIAVTVMVILITVAAPPLQDFIKNVRLTGQANELMTDLMLARSEASKRGMKVSVCPRSGDACSTAADWASGWMVVIDDDSDGRPDSGTNPLKKADAITGANSLQRISGTGGVITFTPTGLVTTSATTLRICDDRDKGRAVRVAVTGRASVTRLDTSCTATKE
jgi:type IV fimbrial biogenesis protein FimT